MRSLGHAGCSSGFNGQTFYEATLSKNGKRYSLHIARKILKREAPESESHEKSK